MKNKLTREMILMFARYLFLILIALPGMQIFYTIFTPLTVYPSFFLLSIAYPAIALQGASFVLDNLAISIIPACIAGAAYYLLLILNFSTPMTAKTRIKSVVFLMLSFLFLNIIRLFAFSVLFINNYQYFDLAHKSVWYFGSTILVVLLWFANVYLFKIKSIPVYTDMKKLFILSKQKNKRKK